ncbi:helix-turn-helix domain-containing protein [Brachyspira aalborgi]|uniref:LuxR family transcriptional regulator n=1 Tax=Brachyspira aalborgi TaxID=29522 RepID=A0A5C8EFV6_9SPIR|nr:helix-turn-helix transcriptional regulator [Brachyspira aalborgi]TXJ36603.1 LuxR family transcriptional regulator [Brachyspira aalborgi]
MNNIFNYTLLILYLIAFIIGFSTIFYSVIYYIIERITWLKYYIVFLFLFGFLLLIRAIKLLSFLAIPLFLSNSIFNILYYFTLSVSMSLILYFIPAFLYRFLNLKWKVKENVLYLILSVIFFVLSILGIILNFNFYIVANIIFYLLILYLLILGFINYKNIKDKMMKLIVKILGLITIFIYPIMVYQLITINKNSLDIGSIDITLVLFYIWWNLVMLGFLLWYFINIIKNKNMFVNESLNNNSNDSKNIENENNEIKKELKEEIINLTKREKQILSYLLSGKTNKEVALILDISLNTVNNHVANIYDKSGVKNRVELVNKFSK